MKKTIVLCPEEWKKLKAIDDTEQLVLSILNTAYSPFGPFHTGNIRVVENMDDNIIAWWYGIDERDNFVNISFVDADAYRDAFVLIDVYRYDGAPITIEYEGTREDNNG